MTHLMTLALAAPRLTGLGALLATCVLCAQPALAGGGFETSGNMITPRHHHTATLLQDGRVLIAGGVKRSVERGPAADAELYDPVAGSFSATGEMSVPRVDHAATLLPDGRVLVVGGWGNDATQANGELYDPASGSFTPITSALAVGGERTAAITLADGRALVVGGFNMGARSGAWLFDPATDTFSETGSLANGRYIHTLNLLADGRVLVVGGYLPDGGPREDAEIYDPVSGTFSTLASTMSVARERHASATLPDGRVLIAGGYTWKGEQLDSADLFDPVTGLFSPSSATMALPRIDFRLVGLQDGRVLAIGSYQWELPAATAELYDPASDSFSSIVPGPVTERSGLDATLLADGRVLLTGGTDLMDPKGGSVAYGEVYGSVAANDVIFADGFESAVAH